MQRFNSDSFPLLTRWWFWVIAALGIAGAAVFCIAALTGSDTDDEIIQMRVDRDVAGLVKVVDTGDDDRAARAVAALGSIKLDIAIPPLLRAAQDPRPVVRERAVLSLVRVSGRKHADKLADALRKDKDPYVRAAAAEALGQVWACDQMPRLLEAMDDPDPTVQCTAIWAVARICGAEPGYQTTAPKERHQLKTGYYRAFWKHYGTLITRYHVVHNKR